MPPPEDVEGTADDAGGGRARDLGMEAFAVAVADVREEGLTVRGSLPCDALVVGAAEVDPAAALTHVGPYDYHPPAGGGATRHDSDDAELAAVKMRKAPD